MRLFNKGHLIIVKVSEKSSLCNLPRRFSIASPIVTLLIVLMLSLFSAKLNAQTVLTKAITSEIEIKEMSHFEVFGTSKRKLLSFKNKPIGYRLNPLTYTAAGLLFFYQRILSKQLQSHCTYEISCSSYAKLAIEKRGVIIGAFIGLSQFEYCVPGNIYDFAKYKIDANRKIINKIDCYDK